MAGQNYTWQVSNSTFIGTGEGRVSSAYNVNGKSPFTTITTSNPDGWVSVNPSSNDQTIKKLERRIDEDGAITYRYNNSAIYSSLQKFRDAVPGVSDSTITQIKSAVASELRDVSQQNNIGPQVASLPPSAAQPGAGPAGNQVGSATVSDIPIPDIKYAGKPRTYDDYVYPTSIRENRQDFIKFTAYEYVGRSLNKEESTSTSIGPNIGFGDREIVKNSKGELKKPLGSATLPIQPSITDLNTVQWGGEEMNALGAYAASASYNATTDMAGTAEAVLRDIDKFLQQGSSGYNATRLFLAGKAAGVSGLLSRVGGAVLNPNLELLFQGPQLRPFNFTFRLSPRDAKEAEQVKYIIRFFKQNMCVKNSDVNLFLKTPNVFQIKYHLAGNTNGDHPSLNRIKICALQSCSVDYTPDGSYMTFNDAGATMTSYNLSLQFQELEPVTEKDYNDLNDETIIGY